MTDLATLPIAELAPDPFNAMTHGEDEIERLADSIFKHGFIEPVVFNARTKTVVGGHGRIIAAQRNGLTELPCVVVTFDDERHRAAGVALNASYGHFNPDRLAGAIRELQAADYALDFTGLAPWRIDDALAGRDAPVAHPPADSTERITEERYVIVFDDDDQRKTWSTFVAWLHDRSPEHGTIGAMVLRHYAEHPAIKRTPSATPIPMS